MSENQNFWTSMALMMVIAAGLICLYALFTLPVVQADAPKTRGEYILWVSFDNGLAEEKVFGGSFLTPEACVISAKLHYPLDKKGWIAYTCIHEDVHEYLESMKAKELEL